MGGWAGYAIRQGARLAIPMGFLHFSRGFESEADYLGLQYLYKSGYDPTAFVDFFEKIQSLEKKKPGTLSKIFSTHPMTDDRIKSAQDEIQKILVAKPEYVVNTSEFNDVKSRLSMLHNSRKLGYERIRTVRAFAALRAAAPVRWMRTKTARSRRPIRTSVRRSNAATANRIQP